MIELTSDPQSICFLQGQRISLPLLKNEIDRRVLKITCMVKKLRSRRHRSPQKHTYHCHRHVQTEPAEQQHRPTLCPEFTSVLATVNQQEKLNRQQPSTCLKPQKQNEKQPIRQLQAKPAESITVGQEGMIQSNGFTFREVGQGRSSAELGESQEDRIFKELDSGLQISNVEMCHSVTSQRELTRFRTGLRAEREGERRGETLTVSSFTELSAGQQREASRRNRKIRMAGREVVLPEPQKRFTVGQECRQRMQLEVEHLISRKRKEACDFKVRMNVLKKIEEKYGEQYSL